MDPHESVERVFGDPELPGNLREYVVGVQPDGLRVRPDRRAAVQPARKLVESTSLYHVDERLTEAGPFGESHSRQALPFPRLPHQFMYSHSSPSFRLSSGAVHLFTHPLPNEYSPRKRLRNGHLMTVYAWGKSRKFPSLPAPVERLFDVAAETKVMAHCHWQASPAARPALLVLHGLEGSSTAHYMRGIADKAWRAGFNVVLLNQRNCGGTEA